MSEDFDDFNDYDIYDDLYESGGLKKIVRERTNRTTSNKKKFRLWQEKQNYKMKDQTLNEPKRKN